MTDLNSPENATILQGVMLIIGAILTLLTKRGKK